MFDLWRDTGQTDKLPAPEGYIFVHPDDNDSTSIDKTLVNMVFTTFIFLLRDNERMLYVISKKVRHSGAIVKSSPVIKRKFH